MGVIFALTFAGIELFSLFLHPDLHFRRKEEPKVFKTTGNYHNTHLFMRTRRPKLTLYRRRGHWWFSAILMKAVVSLL